MLLTTLSVLLIVPIDSASVYRNESEIGAFIKEKCPGLGLSRSDLFITRKLGLLLWSESRIFYLT